MASPIRTSEKIRIPTPEEFATAVASRPYPTQLRKGDADLTWFNAKPGDGVWGSWGVKATPSRRGLTLMDCEAAEGTPVAEVGPASVAPRGAGSEPSLLPREWDINDKWDVWAENLTSLYEEGCSRQWCATQDIDWHKLEMLPPDLERALCQYNTFLTMGEYLATDVLAPWLPQFNTYFHEIKLFIAAQANDEARHTEVFRKRILANGGGLGMTINLGNALVGMGDAAQSQGLGKVKFHENPLFSTWNHVSYAIHVVFEGAILSMFRFGEFLGKTDVDKQIFRMVMQDEARHVAYGSMHLKYLIEHAPDREAKIKEIHALATQAEMFFLELFFLHPATVESCAVLAGNGVDNIGEGLEIYKSLYRKMRAEYLSRIGRAGLDRSELCMFPAELPF
ncbi:MAG: ferritin-like domain-containing protein [Deltaproteobacteria bacterium]|nr:ferritin-like domain-containing protein [Deltaproteobacteria bacterium]